MKMIKKKLRSEAFTLIELLVVVSIIALLISILLPSLRQARSQAKSAVCIANLKGLGTASVVYASDDETEAAIPVPQTINDTGLTPYSRRVTAYYGFGGKAGRGRTSGSTDFWTALSKRGPAHRPLNDVIYKNGFANYENNPGGDNINLKHDQNLKLGTYMCPADNGYQGIHLADWKDSGLTSYDFFGTSYSANVLWIVPASTCPSWVSGECCASNGPFLRPLSRIPSPSNTIYYEENVGRYAYRAPPQGTDESATDCEGAGGPGVPGTVHGWHGRDWVFNVAFADAHADTIRMKGFDNPRMAEWSDADWQFWHCVIIRGQGWQRDTLPAPPVDTTVVCGETG